jgi:integrase
MPVEKRFTDSDIQALITNNAIGNFKARNAALIIGASYWGLTRIELSQLPLSCLMTETGKWYSCWALPKEFALNGEARELYTADHIVPVLDAYLDWLTLKEIELSSLATYRGHNDDMKFFVNDNLKPFALTKRTKKLADNKTSYQPRSMDDKLKSLIANANIQGATPSTFRDSWLRAMYSNGCKVRDLMDISGYKTKSTIVDKIKPEELELEKVFNKVYSRLKF